MSMSRRLFATVGSHRSSANLDPKALERAARRRNEWADKFSRGLGEDGDGNQIVLDAAKKTVATSVGELPISPIMDPDFHEARQRWRSPKEKARKVAPTDLKGRAKAKLRVNAFAQALSTPLRQCPVTQIILPSFFLQKFEAISNPGTKSFWAVPADTVMPTWEEKAEFKVAPEQKPGDSNESTERSATSPPDQAEPSPSEYPYKKPMSPPTTYVLARKPLLRNLAQPKGTVPFSTSLGSLFARRDRFIKVNDVQMVWRVDMDVFVLDNLRRQIVNTILYYIKLGEKDGRAYLSPCGSWEDVARIHKRGCLLWLPSNAGNPGVAGSPDSSVNQFDTYEVPGVKWEKTLPVHDVESLLGQEHMAILRKHALFRDHSLLLVGRDRSVALQLYLWKLQGYSAEYSGDHIVPTMQAKQTRQARQESRETETQQDTP